MPAEQTSTSRPPSSLSTLATAAFSSADLVTSPAIPIVPFPSSSAVAATRPGGTAGESAGTRGGTSDGLGEERRMTASDASTDRPAGNEYPPAPR